MDISTHRRFAKRPSTHASASRSVINIIYIEHWGSTHRLAACISALRPTYIDCSHCTVLLDSEQKIAKWFILIIQHKLVQCSRYPGLGCIFKWLLKHNIKDFHCILTILVPSISYMQILGYAVDYIQKYLHQKSTEVTITAIVKCDVTLTTNASWLN